MFLIEPRDIARLLAAGGPSEWLVGIRWPLHRALIDLAESVALAQSPLPYHAISTRPDPDVGVAVAGADAAVSALVGVGLLVPQGHGLTECWAVDADRLVAPRRELMQLPARDAELVYRAGQRWAALAATSLKNWRTPSRSASPRFGSPMPNRRQVAEPAR